VPDTVAPLVFVWLLVRASAPLLAGLLRPAAGALAHGALAGVAAWLAVALLDAWVPLGLPLAAGLVIGAVRAALPHRWVTPVFEAALVVVTGYGSLTAVPVEPLLGLAAAAALAGVVLDRVLERAGRARVPALVTAAAIVLAGGHPRTPLVVELLRADPLVPLRAAITLPRAGEPIVLSTGAVAWLRPARRVTGTPSVAVVFHGANAAGAAQPAALALQRALMLAGIAVVSLDHPGFGASPAPAATATVAAWDPAPSALAALRAATQIATEGAAPRMLVVGHSLGVADALRVLASGAEVNVALLFGGAASDDDSRDAYWHRRFHEDRRLDFTLPERTWREIEQRYYSTHHLVESLRSPARTRIVFTESQLDFPNVLAQRDELYRSLPEPKARVALPGITHYLNAVQLGPLVLADVRATRRLAQLFEREAAGVRPPRAVQQAALLARHSARRARY